MVKQTFEQKVNAVASEIDNAIVSIRMTEFKRIQTQARRWNDLQKRITREVSAPAVFKKAPVVIGRNADKPNRMTYAEAEDYGLGHMDVNGFMWYANSGKE
jgi:hypothetical protein